MITVTTPTGQIGSRVLEHVLAGPSPVRAIARDPARLPVSVRDRVEVLEGSHDDAELLDAALDGTRSLFWLVPPYFDAADAAGHYEAFTDVLVEALAGRPDVRVVTVSSLGRGYAPDAGLLSPAWAMEQRIEATGVPVRTLRLPFFMENLLNQVGLIEGKGAVAMANTPDRPLASVAAADAARIAADLLLDDSWTGQEGVPFASDTVTPTEMAATMSEVLNRQVRLAAITPDELRANVVGHGASEDWAQGMADMVRAQNDGVYEVEPVPATPYERTPFRAWCERGLAPAVPA